MKTGRALLIAAYRDQQSPSYQGGEEVPSHVAAGSGLNRGAAGNV